MKDTTTISIAEIVTTMTEQLLLHRAVRESRETGKLVPVLLHEYRTHRQSQRGEMMPSVAMQVGEQVADLLARHTNATVKSHWPHEEEAPTWVGRSYYWPDQSVSKSASYGI